MENIYIESDKIEVFPSSNRRENSRSVYTSEINLTGILNSITDQDSFLIKADISNTNSKNILNDLECVINGYYFLINGPIDISSAADNGSDVYLGIRIDESVKDFPALTSIEDGNLDSDAHFKGLVITGSTNNDLNLTHYLKIGSKKSGDILLDDSAYFKFDIKSLYFTDKNNNKVNYPKITSEAYTGSNKPPVNAKKGDIFIVYE